MQGYSINIQNCIKTRKSDLEACLKRKCSECNYIPIPPFTEEDSNTFYCFRCINKRNIKDYPMKIQTQPLNVFEKLRVSCENISKGCKKQFSVRRISDYIKHKDFCEYSYLKVTTKIQQSDKSRWIRNYLNYEIFSFLDQSTRRKVFVNKKISRFKKSFLDFAISEENTSIRITGRFPIDKLKIISNLVSLNITCELDNSRENINIFENITSLVNLRELNIFKLKIANKEISSFTFALSKLINLDELGLFFVQVNLNDDEIKTFFSTLTKMISLKKLALDFSAHSIHKDAILNMSNLLSIMVWLESLILKLNEVRHNLYIFDDSQLNVILSAISKMTSLTRLSLEFSNNFIRSPVIITNSIVKLKNLNKLHLDLSSNIITDISFKELCLLKNLSELSLILSDNTIVDIKNFAYNIPSIVDLKSLQILLDNNNYSNFNKIDNEGLISLSQALSKMKQLETLNLGFKNNNNISEEAISILITIILNHDKIKDVTIDFGKESIKEYAKKVLRCKLGLKVSFLNRKKVII